MAVSPVILWFRQDLRIQDNPALAAAHARGGPVVPVYIFDEGAEGAWQLGGASKWWLHHALESLATDLGKLGSRLIVAHGDAAEILPRLLQETKAEAIYWNRRYEPAIIDRDQELKRSLTAAGVEVKSFNSALLFEPHTITNKQGKPFQVFTPFWRHCLALPVAEPVRFTATNLPAPNRWPKSLSIDELGLLPRINWTDGVAAQWTPGEAGAQRRLRRFIKHGADDYAKQRDLPEVDGTSMLSPWLHFGELGPRQVWAAAKAMGKSTGAFPSSNGVRVWLSEIGWREFAYHLLYHYPHTPTQPLRPNFERFPWAPDHGGRKLHAWQRGRTGYPIVDAGMRQLWSTGWMHNRVRMVVASFLVKHLRLSWTHGAEWFWETLVDADLASNTLGWQWSAGCGADAAPYFRIFAPVTQGERFDPEGNYIRRWVPELAAMPAKWIHHPWEAPTDVLATAEVELGGNYPGPIVDHRTARTDALAAFKSLRTSP